MKNKNNIWTIPFTIMGLLLLLPNGCKKEEVSIAPSTTTASVTDITQTTATGGGAITSDGGATITARGVCWGTSATPTIADSKSSDGGGTGSFTSSIAGLTPNTTYQVRAYATNEAGTGYGSVISFTTLPLPVPELTTTAVTSIGLTTASSGGNITSDGGFNVTARGVCWSTSASPTITDSKTTDGTGTGSFASNITGLTANTTYNVRAYATTSVGTGYGSIVSFTTLQLPTVTTTAISEIEISTAMGGGNVTSSGGSAITAHGICWGTSPSPTLNDSKTDDGGGAGAFASSLSGLAANATYHVRAYATSSLGTSYGNDVTFMTYGLIDIGGNGYHSIVIGTQEWMKENLKTTAYRDGTAIPNVTDVTAWTGLSTGAYCEYENTSSNVAIYGRLYNWFAVTDSRQLCPTGWHGPDDSEWDLLATYLGGADAAGGKMKTTGTNQAGSGLWNTPNTGATNESGFSGFPGGDRGDVGNFNDVRDYGMWWTTNGAGDYGDFRHLHSFDAKLSANNNFKINGKSVRCVKD